MAPETFTTDMERRDARIARLEETGHYPERGIVAGGTSLTPAAARTFIATAGPTHLAQVDQGLDEAETTAARRAKYSEAWRAEDDRRELARQPLAEGDPEHADAQRMFAEAADRARYAASTEGKLDRLIELNERIVAALEKR